MAEVFYARDELTDEDVCVKKMQHWEQFQSEITGRLTSDGETLSRDCVINVLRWHTPAGLTLTNMQGQTEEPQHTAADDKHPFVLVMARGQRSLHDACAKERIAGYDSQAIVETFRSVVMCVQDLHESGVVHADLKQR